MHKLMKYVDTSLIIGLCLVSLDEMQRPQNHDLKIRRHSVKNVA